MLDRVRVPAVVLGVSLTCGDIQWNGKISAHGMNVAVAAAAGVETDPSDDYWDDAFAPAATDGPVRVILADDAGNVYIGGEFTTAGGIPANNIARWDGSAWFSLGSGVNGLVRTLALDGNGDLYAGGAFTTAGGTGANGIARWNGSAWSPLGSGVNDEVRALAVDGSDLYAGGLFTAAGGSPMGHIARWDGSNWSSVGAGMDSNVLSLAGDGNGTLYAGGSFTTVGGDAADYIAQWDGSSWSPLGSGMNNYVFALALDGSDLYAGGYFTTAGGTGANRIARWDGSTWSPLGAGLSSSAFALFPDGGRVYTGGTFASAGGSAANRIAAWDGSVWSAFGSGMDDRVSALAVTDSSLLAGGEFTTAGGKASANFARWQPRVARSTAALSADPGNMTLGNAPDGFYKPALTTYSGTSVSYAGGLPVTVTMDRAPEIHVAGRRINGAFTLDPEGVAFSGTVPMLRVEFSEDDAAAFAVSSDSFRAVRLTYPADYPGNKEAASVELLSESTAVPIRVENGRQIYAITVPFTVIGSTYGAAPDPDASPTPRPTPECTGYEADVAPRPNGSGACPSITDWVQVGRFVAGLDTATCPCEFQKADCAPAGTQGNGAITITDWVQAGRYASALDACTPVGGPGCPSGTKPLTAGEFAAAPLTFDTWKLTAGRTLRIVDTSIERGESGTVSIELDSEGDENALGFSVDFDPSLLTCVSAATGSGAAGAILIVNDSQAGSGRLGLILSLGFGETFAAGTHEIVVITFSAAGGSTPTTTDITFGDTPVPREISDPLANPPTASYVDGRVTLTLSAVPTATPTGTPTGTAANPPTETPTSMPTGTPTPTETPAFHGADINRDGCVNVLDLRIMLAALKTVAGDPYCTPEADLNGDGAVTVDDLVTVARNMRGKCDNRGHDMRSNAPPGYARSLMLSPSRKNPDVGEIVTVDVLVLHPVELAALQFNVEFDAENLELIDTIEGDILTGDGALPVFVVDGLVTEPGTLERFCAAALSDQGVTGFGRALTLKFLVVGSGRAQVAVTDALLVDIYDAVVPVDYAGTVLNGPARARRPALR